MSMSRDSEKSSCTKMSFKAHFPGYKQLNHPPILYLV